MRTGMQKKAAIVAVAIGMVAAAQADIVITEENFNGALPTTGWTFMNGATNDGSESVISGTADGYSLNLDRTGDGLPQGRNAFAVPGSDADLNLKISFDYNAVEQSAQQQVFRLWGNNKIAIQLGLSLNTSGVVQNSEDGGWGATLGTLTQGEWYHVEIVTVPQSNAGADSYDLTITDTNGTAVISQANLAFAADVTSYDGVRWAYNTGTVGPEGQFYIDNLVVETIPEPAALGLVVISSTGLLILRRFHI